MRKLPEAYSGLTAPPTGGVASHWLGVVQPKNRRHQARHNGKVSAQRKAAFSEDEPGRGVHTRRELDRLVSRRSALRLQQNFGVTGVGRRGTWREPIGGTFRKYC